LSPREKVEVEVYKGELESVVGEEVYIKMVKA
jgi:hypothetical protein